MFHEGASTAELGRELSFFPFPYTLSRQPLPSIYLSVKALKDSEFLAERKTSGFSGLSPVLHHCD